MLLRGAPAPHARRPCRRPRGGAASRSDPARTSPRRRPTPATSSRPARCRIGNSPVDRAVHAPRHEARRRRHRHGRHREHRHAVGRRSRSRRPTRPATPRCSAQLDLVVGDCGAWSGARRPTCSPAPPPSTRGKVDAMTPGQALGTFAARRPSTGYWFTRDAAVEHRRQLQGKSARSTSPGRPPRLIAAVLAASPARAGAARRALGLAPPCSCRRCSGFQRYVITSGSMTGTYDRGSLVFDRVVPTSSLREGDVITFTPPARPGRSRHPPHRLA